MAPIQAVLVSHRMETIPTGTTATATIGAPTTRSGTIAVIHLADKALVPTAFGTNKHRQ